MNGTAGKRIHAIAYLRQLCCSGLDKGLIIPEFLRAIRPVISSSNNVFGYTDANCGFVQTMTFGYLVPEVVEIYDHLVASYWTTELLMNAATAFKQQTILGNPSCIDDQFYKSDLYNLGHLPNEQHHCIATTVLHFKQPVGFISLHRPVQQKDFSEKDKALLLQIIPYLAHAIAAPALAEIEFYEKGTIGLLVLDSKGTLHFQSQLAKQQMDLVCFSELHRNQANNRQFLLIKLADLCRRFASIYRGQNAEPPSFCHINARGRFIFRAQWLDKLNSEPGGLAGITIEHQEPLLIKILRGLQHFPLSPAQSEVAGMIAQGKSNEDIGKRLGIKLTTVKDHVGKIYEKLDIRRREELLPKILAKADNIGDSPSRIEQFR